MARWAAGNLDADFELNNTSPNPYRGFRFPAEVIEHAAWLYHCFNLSLRDVETILAARGIVVSCESIRDWGLRFGQLFANALNRRRPRPDDKWLMDEVCLRIRGKLQYLWRAVDQASSSTCTPTHNRPWPPRRASALPPCIRSRPVCAGKSLTERLATRQAMGEALFADPRTWLEHSLGRISGKSSLAGAIRYTLSRWEALTLVLRDGRTCLDNNAAERAMRPMCLGRKNWLFAGSDAGGERAAAAYSLIETAKLNGLDPEDYLRHILTGIADHPVRRTDELLPWHFDAIRARRVHRDAPDHIHQRG